MNPYTLRVPDPKSDASTNSATSAECVLFYHAKASTDKFCRPNMTCNKIFPQKIPLLKKFMLSRQQELP